MSNLSGASSGTSRCRSSGRVVGVPSKCWCGEKIVKNFSKTDWNPNRRYYRCDFAATKKLGNDDHVFKWVDEAMYDEIQNVDFKIARLEQDMEDLKKLEMKVEDEIFERVDNMLMEAKWGMKKMIVVLVFGIMIMVGCVKLMG